MKIIDLSRPLSPGIAVWPGDRPFEAKWSSRLEEGEAVNLGAVSMSLHTGTHADAPLHFEPDGTPVDRLPLDAFIGPAVVVDVGEAEAIHPSHAAAPAVTAARRVLFRTRASQVPITDWSADFAPLLVETVEALAQQGVVLVGTDAPSVDPAQSKDLPAHHALARCGIINLENLMLRDVAPGMYQLIALPLRLVGMDASPVRAVLIDEGG